MRWPGRDPNRWRRGFAWLPMRPIGATAWVWLEPYWWRPCGEYTATTFTDPALADVARSASPRQSPQPIRDDQTPSPNPIRKEQKL